MWKAIRLRELGRAHDPEPTVAFRSQYAYHYETAGLTLPDDAKVTADQRASLKRFQTLPFVQRTGLELGLGGLQDLAWLHGALSGKKLRTERVSLPGEAASALALEMPEDERTQGKVREIFHEQVFRPVPGLAAPKAVLDIGSGIGLAAAFFRLSYPKAFLQCAEPDPRTFRILNSNAKTIGNCAAVCAGLTFGTQIRQFHLDSQSSTAEVPGRRSARQVMSDAERFVQALTCKHYDLVKIDTGGREIPILLSLRKRLATTPVIHLSYYSDADHRIMDAMLGDTHAVSRSTVHSPNRGTLCYVLRSKSVQIKNH
jgi:FkbM family methyltransferase